MVLLRTPLDCICSLFLLGTKLEDGCNPCNLAALTLGRRWQINFLQNSSRCLKTAQLRVEIGQFKQLDFEPLYEAWERYKDLICRCPQHGYEDWTQIQFFYTGLNGQTRNCWYCFWRCFDIQDYWRGLFSFRGDATNSYQWPNERSLAKKVAGIHQVDLITVTT